MYEIVGFLLTISIVTLAHEFGHYYIAKRHGVIVEEFAIGFGRELYSIISKDGIKWKLCSIPLGGFVKLRGLTSKDNKQPFVAVDKTAFYAQPLYVRFLIVAAGPLSNYLLAILIIFSCYMQFGKMVTPAVIENVVADSPAALGGLESGDNIIKIDGKRISSFAALQQTIMINPNRQLNFVVIRNNKEVNIWITPSVKYKTDLISKTSIGYIGITGIKQHVHLHMNFIESAYQAAIDSINITKMIFTVCTQMILGKRSIEEISGIITIAKASGQFLASDINQYMLFIAMLSINVGFINLLPIPVLDGGYLLLLIIEMIRRRPLDLFTRNLLIKCGQVVVLFIVVISVSNDIKHLFLLF